MEPMIGYCGLVCANSGWYDADFRDTDWFVAIFGAEYVLRLLPRGTHRWREFRQPAEVEALLNAAGLDVLQRTGVKLNPFSRHFSLVANMNVNYMLLAARPRTG